MGGGGGSLPPVPTPQQSLATGTPAGAPAGNPFASGTPTAGSWGSPNLSVNPYLSPYLGMFSSPGGGAPARPLFSLQGMSPAQQRFMGRQTLRSMGSTNQGNVPLPVVSRQGTPPPAPTPQTPSTGVGKEPGTPGYTPPPGTYVDDIGVLRQKPGVNQPGYSGGP
jgi:hypothetical protein